MSGAPAGATPGRLRVVLGALMRGEALEATAVERLFGAVMDGELSEAEAAALLVALRMKGETGVELAAAARAMRERAVPVTAPAGAVDTCGTGGDGAGTVNISTAAALVAAAGGVAVAKHGNRSVSSSCGSADVLEASGVRLDVSPEDLGRLIAELGIAFLFAPRLHPAMRAVMPVRRVLGVRTTFNLLGPLTNPARVRRQVVGVWGPKVLHLVAHALAELGAEHALVVHSADGLDEISVAAPTIAVEVRDGRVVDEILVEPAGLGLGGLDASQLRGGDAAENAARLAAILGGEERSAASAAVAVNAGAALWIGGAAGSLAEGSAMALDLLAAGSGLGVLQRLARRSAELADA